MKSFSGYGSDFTKLIKKTGLQGAIPSNVDWVQISLIGNKALVKSQVVAYNQVPDVRGMGLKDAMYLLENQSYYFKII